MYKISSLIITLIIAVYPAQLALANTNNPPVAENDYVSTVSDQQVTYNVLTNDYDPDQGYIYVSAWSYNGTFSGSLSYGGNGQFTYTPDINFHGTTSYSYWVNDLNGGQDTGTVNIDVQRVNNAPVAVADNVSTIQDQQISIDTLANDYDVDGDSIHVAAASSSQSTLNGTLALANNIFTYTPNPGFTGNATFTYWVADNFGGQDTGTVTIYVSKQLSVNDESLTVDEDNTLSGDVLANDSGEGVLSANLDTQALNGIVSLSSNGTFDYTPDTDFNGTDSFTYTVSAENGQTATGTTTITVDTVNDAPVASNDSFSGDEDTQITGNVLINDSDVDSATLQAYTVQSTTNGSLSLNTDGSFTYTANANFYGQDSFTYYAEDSAGATSTATVTIAVNPVNDAPVAQNDNFTVNEDVQLTGDVLANDSDVDGDTLQVTVLQTTSNGSLALNANGQFTYTPNTNFYGQDSFTYQVQDPSGATNTATASITVDSVNDAPSATLSHSEQGKTRRITFDPAGSNDIDGTIVSYFWDYGNGNTYSTSSATPHEYRYGSKGTYTVTLTVTDNEGGQSQYVSTVNPG